MWTQVEQAIDDIKPLVASIGLDLRVDDVLDQVVSIEVLRLDSTARPDMARLRDFVERELRDVVPDVLEVRFIGDAAPPPAPSGVSVTWTEPPADADTVVVKVGLPVGPPATASFDAPSDAAQWPAVAAVLGVPGVVSVVARAGMMIVARDEATPWSAVLPALPAVIREALGGGGGTDLRARVQRVLDAEINPALSAHGGFIEIVNLVGGDLTIHMGGGCQGCAKSQATLRLGVERQIRERVPEIVNILDATDHDAGENPYFSA
jgi:Fe-S cluster biogenesis protein NfuA/enamine deaminase RidA (YjgF/YER057c/UK114 family)